LLISESAKSFERFLEDRGRTIDTLSGRDALPAFIDWYQVERADDALGPNEDGDMMLFEWGTYDWGHGPTFQYGVTRQFIGGDGEDEDLWQLRLVLHFADSDQTQLLGSGNQWCHSTAEVSSFADFVAQAPATHYVLGQAPLRVELDLGQAG
jgi:hypothetical protein